jgi:hypothetical protein
VTSLRDHMASRGRETTWQSLYQSSDLHDLLPRLRLVFCSLVVVMVSRCTLYVAVGRRPLGFIQVGLNGRLLSCC